MNGLSGTKEHIFDAFVQMTSELGYENVAMRDVADKVGIQVASIYNHFSSKQKLLEYAYDYFEKYRYENRTPSEEMNRLIETASAEKIVYSFMFTYESENQLHYIRMVLIVKIIHMRMFQDKIANRLFLDQYTNNTPYVVDVLKHGIAVGRVHQSFDVATFAEILIGAMISMGIKSFAGAAYDIGQLDQENYILALLARLLSTALI